MAENGEGFFARSKTEMRPRRQIWAHFSFSCGGFGFLILIFLQIGLRLRLRLGGTGPFVPGLPVFPVFAEGVDHIRGALIE